MIFIGGLLPDLRGGEGDQREDPRLLDLHRQLPLVLRAVPRDAAGDDLSPFGDELLDHVRVLVVDRELFLRAEAAELLADVPLLPSSGRTAMLVAPGTGRCRAGLVRGAHRVLPPWNPDRIFFRTGYRRLAIPAPAPTARKRRPTRRAARRGTGRCPPRPRSCSALRRRSPSSAAGGAPRPGRDGPWKGTRRNSRPSSRTPRRRRRRPLP